MRMVVDGGPAFIKAQGFHTTSRHLYLAIAAKWKGAEDLKQMIHNDSRPRE